MALQKGIVGADGVATNYHRVVNVSIIINSIVLIEVASYVNRKYRENQIEFNAEQELGNKPSVALPHIITRYYDMPYVESISISDIYSYLKTLPEFEGAEDVLDDEENVEEEATQ